MLNLCGVYLGREEDMLQPGPENPEGFWEHKDLFVINDRILADSEGAWDDPPGFIQRSDKLTDATAQAARLITELRRSPVWGVKDPRFCLTYPIWSAMVRPQVVLCLRNPLEVAQSLAKRNGFSIDKGLNLWRLYQRRLLESVDLTDCIVIHYETLLIACGPALRRMLFWLGLHPTDEIVQNACRFPRRELHRNQAQLAELACVADYDTVEFYARLCLRDPIYARLWRYEWHLPEPGGNNFPLGP
jgi:hypothetical protein